MEKIFRLIDANFNRAREGLRVIEDAVRFYYELDEFFIQEIKSLRHRFSQATAKHFTFLKLKTYRDTVRDKGKNLDIRNIQDVRATVEKNFMRVGEALRVIEEYSKIIAPAASHMFHDFRFNLYDIEKKLCMKIYEKKPPVPFIYVIYKLTEGEKDVEVSVGKVLEGKPDFFEICYYGKHQSEFLKRALGIKRLLPADILYIVKSRADICALCNADGLALEIHDIPVTEAKKLLPGKIMVLYTKKIKDITLLSKKGFDYILFQPLKQPLKSILLTDLLKKVNIPLALMNNIDVKEAVNYIKQGVDGIVLCAEKETSPYIGSIIKDIKTGIKTWEINRIMNKTSLL